jgi:hypothetical protein
MPKRTAQASADWTKDVFWGLPSFDPSHLGDTHEFTIHMAVGRALSAWEQMEDHLGNLFLQLSAPRGQPDNHSYLVARHLFGLTQSSMGRIVLLRATAELYFQHYWKNGSVKKPYNDVLNAVGWASHRRNEIAHGRTIQVQNHKPNVAPQSSGWFLIAPDYNIGRQQPFYDRKWNENDVIGISKSKYRYRTSDINSLSDKFYLLCSKIMELGTEGCMTAQGVPSIVLRLESDIFTLTHF